MFNAPTAHQCTPLLNKNQKVQGNRAASHQRWTHSQHRLLRFIPLNKSIKWCMKNWETMSSLSSKDQWVTSDIWLHICSVYIYIWHLTAYMQYKQKLSLCPMGSFGELSIFLCPAFASAGSPQLEWAFCSSPWTPQDGNLVLHCFLSRDEFLRAILSSARGRGRQEKYF